MTYQEIINGNNAVLIEFYATWCPHCTKMIPVVAKAAELLEGKMPVVQLDIDQNEKDADNANVETIPTFILYKDGKEVWRHSGEIEGDVLVSTVMTFA